MEEESEEQLQEEVTPKKSRRTRTKREEVENNEEEEVSLDEEEQQEQQEGDDEEQEEEVEEEEDTRSLFEQLFDTYQKVTTDLQEESGMEHVLNEYTKLFEAARDWHIQGEELQTRTIVLEEELGNLTTAVVECAEQRSMQREEIGRLRQDVTHAQRLADAANAREQQTVETMCGMRAHLSALTKDMDHKARVVAEAEERKGATTFLPTQTGSLDLERDRIMDELTVVRERLVHSVKHARDVEAQAKVCSKENEQLVQQLEESQIEVEKVTSLKERALAELQTLRNELYLRQTQMQALKDQKEATERQLKGLQEKNKALKLTADRLDKENKHLKVRNNKLYSEKETFENAVGNLRREIKKRNVDLSAFETELQRGRKEAMHLEREAENAARRAEVAMAARHDVEHEMMRLRSDVLSSLENDLRLARDSALADARTMDHLKREKDVLSKSLDRCHEMGAEQAQAMRLQETNRRALADELDVHIVASRKQRKQLDAMEMERDRLVLHASELEGRMQDALEDVRLKQMELYDDQRRIEVANARLRHQQNLYDTVCEERNALAKQVNEAHEQILEVKQRMKVQEHHVEQMKEDVTSKETDLRQAAHLIEKMEKEKEKLRMVLEAARNDIFPERAQVVAAAAALARERTLMRLINLGEKNKRQMMGEISMLMGERDTLGSQLVRRNDELRLLYQKNRLLELSLSNGEAGYRQRLQDLRLLKAEVLRLRSEKMMLQRTLDNMADLRKEVFHLHRDLTHERIRNTALEEELQNPLNVHRWRKLKFTDPPTFELIEKVQLLQKRLLAQAADALERESQLQHALRLYDMLRKMVQRLRPDTVVMLERTRQALRRRGRSMKVLAAEANMYHMEAHENEYELVRKQEESKELRKENLQLLGVVRRQRAALRKKRLQLAELRARCARPPSDGFLLCPPPPCPT